MMQTAKLLQFRESPERGIKEQKRDENQDPLVHSGLNQPASHTDINLSKDLSRYAPFIYHGTENQPSAKWYQNQFTSIYFFFLF